MGEGLSLLSSPMLRCRALRGRDRGVRGRDGGGTGYIHLAVRDVGVGTSECTYIKRQTIPMYGTRRGGQVRNISVSLEGVLLV